MPKLLVLAGLLLALAACASTGSGTTVQVGGSQTLSVYANPR